MFRRTYRLSKKSSTDPYPKASQLSREFCQKILGSVAGYVSGKLSNHPDIGHDLFVYPLKGHVDAILVVFGLLVSEGTSTKNKLNSGKLIANNVELRIEQMLKPLGFNVIVHKSLSDAESPEFYRITLANNISTHESNLP